MVSAEVPVFFLRFSLGRGEEKMKEKDTTIGQAPIRDARTLGAPGMLVWVALPWIPDCTLM